MKKSCIALAFLVATSCATFAEIPTTAEGWYTPSDGFTDCEGSVEISYTEGKKTYSMVLKTDNDGSISSRDLASAQEALKHNTVATLLQFAQHIIQSENLALVNQQRIRTLGENLNSVFSASEITIDGVSPSGTPYTQTLKFKSGKLGNKSGGESIATEKETQDVDITDGETIEWTGDNKLRLKGWGTANSKSRSDTFKYGYGWLLGKTLDRVGLQYFRMPGLASCLDVVETGTMTKPLQLQLKNWDKGYKTTCEQTAASLIESANDNVVTHYFLMKAGDELHYVPTGKLKAGAACDDVSVTTNEAYGAIAGGKVSLLCYDVAPDFAIPHKGAEAYGSKALDWSTLGDLVDGTSLSAKDSLIPGKEMPKLEVAGAHDYAGKSKNHYFGTSQGEGAELGWWELPNVTTNMVIGDETTIVAGVRAPGATFDASAKVMGLYNWNYSWNGDCPLVLLNSGGALAYIPLDEIYTNGLDSCSNRWVKALEWIGDGGSLDGDDGGIKFGTHGSLGSLVASYADDKSIEAAMKTTASEDGEEPVSASPIFSLKGWRGGEEQVKCDQTAAGLLVGSGKPDYKHEFLMRVGDGTLHYVPVGTLATADENTITTNAATSVAGKLAIKGAYDPDNKDKALFSTGSGIEWKDAAGGNALKFVGTDGGDGVVVGSGSTTNTVTFASASDSNVKVKVEGSGDGSVKVTIGVYYK